MGPPPKGLQKKNVLRSAGARDTLQAADDHPVTQPTEITGEFDGGFLSGGGAYSHARRPDAVRSSVEMKRAVRYGETR